MKEMTVPIDQAGRIVLPKDLRRELAIKAGDTFKIAIHGSSVTLTPSKEATGLVRKGKALVFASRGNQMLSREMVARVLEEGRDERHQGSSSGLHSRKYKG